MDKIKHKTPLKTFFRYILDEYILFRRNFVIETAASPRAIETQLRRLNNQKRGCLPRGKMGVTFNQAEDTRHFVIAVAHIQKRGVEQFAKAEGIIERNADDMTVLRGKVWMSGYGSWIAIGIGLAQVVYFNVSLNMRDSVGLAGMLLMSGVMFIFPAMFWLQMYLDRNLVLKEIYAAVHQAESSHNPEKVKVEKSKEFVYNSEQPLVNKAKR